MNLSKLFFKLLAYKLLAVLWPSEKFHQSEGDVPLLTNDFRHEQGTTTIDPLIHTLESQCWRGH